MLQAQGLRKEEGRESCQNSNHEVQGHGKSIGPPTHSAHQHLNSVYNGFSIPTENTRTQHSLLLPKKAEPTGQG